jgi:hypothetical protein
MAPPVGTYLGSALMLMETKSRAQHLLDSHPWTIGWFLVAGRFLARTDWDRDF